MPLKNGQMLRERIILLCVAVGLLAILTEVGFRAYFAFRVGPSVLLRGFVPTENRTMDYKKYRPGETRVDTDMDTNDRILTRMNSRGFRGEEFTQQKAKNTVRVITLGASSTFGFRDRDNETYPYFLEEMLNERCGGSRTFEVINLGIPHLEARHIHALFLAEGLNLDPDVVTFYEGVNDSKSEVDRSAITGGARRRLRTYSWLRYAYRWLRDFSVFVGYLDQVIAQEVREVSATDLAAVASKKSAVFMDYLSKIRAECESRDILFVVANQQSRSLLLEREETKGVTYEQEAILVKERLTGGAALSANQRYFLIHNKLMEDLDSWATEESIPFVDVIGALDQDRDTIVSWVHLNASGNKIVAEVFADKIVENMCPQ